MEKPRPRKLPKGLPKGDPLFFLQPLYHTYAQLAPGHQNDPRLHPALAKLDTLPPKIMLVIPEIDIIVHEQLVFVERLRTEIEDAEHAGGEAAEAVKGRRVESVLYENEFHSFLEGSCFFTARPFHLLMVHGLHSASSFCQR